MVEISCCILNGRRAADPDPPATSISGLHKSGSELIPPDCSFWLLLPSGKPCKTSCFGVFGKIAQNESRLPKFSRFRCQRMATRGFKIEVNFAPCFSPSDTRIGPQNANMLIFFRGVGRDLPGTTLCSFKGLPAGAITSLFSKGAEIISSSISPTSSCERTVPIQEFPEKCGL